MRPGLYVFEYIIVQFIWAFVSYEWSDPEFEKGRGLNREKRSHPLSSLDPTLVMVWLTNFAAINLVRDNIIIKLLTHCQVCWLYHRAGSKGGCRAHLAPLGSAPGLVHEAGYYSSH
jgi:hypothetical protein